MSVFLGGVPSKKNNWREKLIPMLSVDFYRPSHTGTKIEDEEQNNNAKERLCDIHLYVISKEMSNFVHIAEAVESSYKRKKKAILAVMPEGISESVLSQLRDVGEMIEVVGGKYVETGDLFEIAEIVNAVNRRKEGVQVKFKRLDPRAIIPKKMTKHAAGYDICALDPAVVSRGKVTIINTGIASEIPNGYELQLRMRSGMAAKQGLFLVNGVGTIDADYRGEIKLIASSISEDVTINAGERVGQLVLNRVPKSIAISPAFLTETERGEGGFGHTGK